MSETTTADVMIRMLDMIEERMDEQEERISNLEKAMSYQVEEDTHKGDDEEEVEIEQDEEENEDDEQVFPVEHEPKYYDASVRRNFIVEWLKKQGKFETVKVYDILEDVFDYNAHSSDDEQYKAIREAVKTDARIVPQNGRTNPQEYKLSNKVKRDE